MPPLPSEPRPLYEVLQEVRKEAKTGELYSSGHGYVMGGQEQEINIQKSVPAEKVVPAAKGNAEEEKKKKEQEKKNKYNVKF